MIDLEKPPIPLSWYDALAESDHIYGEDKNEVHSNDETFRWEGELIDGYPEAEDPAKQRKRRQAALAAMRFDRAIARELPHVEPAAEPVRLYVARVRAAMRLGLGPDDVHGRFYGGRAPEGLERLERTPFEREARWARGAKERPTAYRRDKTPDLDASDESIPEAKLRGFAAARAREAGLVSFAEQMMTGFAPNDRVTDGTDASSAGTIDSVDQTAGTVKVKRDVGGEVTYDKDSAGELQRQANQRGVVDQHHAPKGAHGAAEKGAAGDASADGAVVLNDPSLLPEHELVAILRWPNLTALSAAVPKMAHRDWFAGIERAIGRELGSWHPDPAAYELEARLPTREAAQRLARRLVEDFYVRPEAITGAVERTSDRYMRVASAGRKTALRVDTARRVLLPGGYVFALEGAAMPSSFQVGDAVLVADDLTNVLTEGKVAAVGPDVAVILTYDGQQYEYARGLFRKLHLARLNLADAPFGMLPARQRVVVGAREGVLLEADESRARVRFEDGPRWFPRERVAALVRVAELP